MTLKEVAAMVAEIGLPYAYYAFPEGTEQPTPFVCFYYPGSDDLAADNSNYCTINELTIELYTDEPRFDLMTQIQSVLAAHGLTWTWTEDWIESERMVLVTYQTEVLING